MKNTILFLITLSLAISLSNAQSGISLKPGTEGSYTVQTNDLISDGVTLNPDFSLGYKPAPFKLEYKPRPAWDLRYKSSAALPSSFDLRTEGRVTGAKSQGSGNFGGNCLSFASMGSIESRWLSMGFGEFDLSEQNMAACSGFDETNWGYGQGGNQYTCSAYLTRFDGPVLEADDPYDLIEHSCIDDLEPFALIPESRWLPGRDFDLLKRSIYNYGAVIADIHWDASSFNAANNTYYYNGNDSTNHAILVCGWDDAMVTDGGSGAWIVKNSWDTTWADKGFFYISYQDKQFAANQIAYFPVRWENDEVDTAYMHDNLGFTAPAAFANISKLYELAKFTAPESQLITHVGVAVGDPETVLDFEIFGNFDGETLSNSLGSRKGLYVEITGIYTFELPVIVDGDFYVQVSREVGADEVNFPIEKFVDGFSDPVIEADVNWVRRDGETKWSPTIFQGSGIGYNLTVRAYAKTTSDPKALFMSDKKEACLGSEVTYTYLQNNPATSYVWDFGKDATPATASTEGPHMVTYSSEGTKTVSLIVNGTGGADTVIRYDYIDVVPSIRVNILKSTIQFQQGQSVEVSAYGADSYEWSPASLVNTVSGQTVTATPAFVGSHELYVTGTQGSCTSTDTVVLETTNKPVNDDMCDAILIKPGGWIGNYSNEFATQQINEPAPDEGDCYTQTTTWCIEGGVQNSLWFYFYGPEEGLASVRTTTVGNFDNQIAIYREDTCIGITRADLVAANDDYSTSELAATLDAVTVTPGEKYFLQIDGSAGGDKGITQLFFYAYPTGSEEFTDSQVSSLSVYPNPGRDIFNISLDDVRTPNVDVILYNLSGQVIMRKSFHDIPGEFFTKLDLSRQVSGIYHLRVMDGERIIDRKLVKE